MKLKPDAVLACMVILIIGVLLCTIPYLYKVTKKKQEAADNVEILQKKVDAKKAAGEMTNGEFIDTFLKQTD